MQTSTPPPPPKTQGQPGAGAFLPREGNANIPPQPPKTQGQPGAGAFLPREGNANILPPPTPPESVSWSPKQLLTILCPGGEGCETRLYPDMYIYIYTYIHIYYDICLCRYREPPPPTNGSFHDFLATFQACTHWSLLRTARVILLRTICGR